MRQLLILICISAIAFLTFSCNPVEESEAYDLNGDDIVSLDISGVSNAERLFITKDGQYAVVNTDSSKGPIYVNFNSLKYEDLGLTIYSGDDFVPHFASFGENTIYFGNVNESTFDFVLVNEKGEESFFWDVPFIDESSSKTLYPVWTKTITDLFDEYGGDLSAEDLARIRFIIKESKIIASVLTGTRGLLYIDTLLGDVLGDEIRRTLERHLGAKTLKEIKYKTNEAILNVPGFEPFKVAAVISMLDMWAEEKYEEKIADKQFDEAFEYKDYYVKLRMRNDSEEGTSNQLNLFCGPEAGRYFINVDTKIQHWRVEYDYDRFYQAGRIVGGKQVFVDVSKNDLPDMRFGTVRILTDETIGDNPSKFSGYIYITQSPNDNYFKLSDDTLIVPKEGGEYTVTVEQDEDVDFWYFTGDQRYDWCSVNKIDNSRLSIRVNEYDGARDPEATICVSAVSKNQSRPDYSVSLKILQETGPNKEELRNKLIQLYRDTNGQNWHRNENWCTDKPLEEWAGIFLIRKGEELYGPVEEDLYWIDLCDNNLEGKIDLSRCPSLGVFDCACNNITSLDVSNCLSLIALNCSSNQITDLDFSCCNSLAFLCCSENPISSFDVSGMTSLKQLFFVNESPTSINVSGCSALEKIYFGGAQTLNASGCTSLTSNGLVGDFETLYYLDLSGCTSLESLRIRRSESLFKQYDEHSFALNVSGCVGLKTLYYQLYFPLRDLDVSGCSALELVELSNLAIENLSITNLSSLKELLLLVYTEDSFHAESYCISECESLETVYLRAGGDCSLSKLILTDCPSLDQLTCYAFTLGSLSIIGCPSLKTLKCIDNSLAELSAPECSELNYLECRYNNLSSLDISHWRNLSYLDCSFNQLSTLDISNFVNLQNLICNNNQLSALDVSGCTSLWHANFSYNNISSFNARGCTSLQGVNSAYNAKPMELNLSGCSSIKRLRYSPIITLSTAEYAISSLDVSGCTSLLELSCRSNQLSYLDVTGCISLEELDVGNNSLTSLDVSSCSALRILRCKQNKIIREIRNEDLLETFEHDERYVYDVWDPVTGAYLPGVVHTNPYGWYFPGEPGKGYHGR